MKLTPLNVRQWARATDYEPSAWTGPRTIRHHIHDQSCRKCFYCAGVFTDDGDFSEDLYERIDERICLECEVSWGHELRAAA